MADVIDKVVLINPFSGRRDRMIERGEDYLPFKFIEEGLRETGFHNIVKFPSRLMNWWDMITDSSNGLLGELRAGLKEDWNIVFGLPVMTEAYRKSEFISEIIRKEFPFSTIVAGGPHIVREDIFDREGLRHLDAVELALLPRISNSETYRNLFKTFGKPKTDRPLADFAVVGHMQPFIEFVLNDGEFSRGIEGLYTLEDGQIAGAGRGSLPRLNNVPLIYFNKKRDDIGGEIKFAYAQLRSSCPNHCKYCAVDNGISFPVGMAVEGLERMLKDAPNSVINFLDPNPMAQNSAGYYIEVLDKLRQRGINPHIQCYIDPSLLVDEKYLKELVKIFIEYSFYNYFIGMDCVDQDVAKVMGRNVFGRPRTQEELDAEQEAVKRFISELKAFHLKVDRSVKQMAILSYLITPFDNYDTTLKTINQAEKFETRSDGYVKVDARLGNLIPLPGTPLRKEHAHWIKDPEDFSTHNDRENPWSLDIGPQARFLEDAGLLFSRKDYPLLRERLNQVYKRR